MRPWTTATIGEAFEVVTGKTPPKHNADLYGDDVPFVKPPELVDGVIESAKDSLSLDGAEQARVLPPRSILVSCIGNLGKVGLNATEVAFNQQINALLPNYEAAEPEFMFYQVKSPSFQRQLASLASGTTVSIVNKSKFNRIVINLPSLPEQKRIVSILDEAFAAIDRAKEIAQQNLANARELFESYLNRVFTDKGEGWEESTVGDQLTLQRGFDITKKQQRVGDIPVVSSGGVKSHHDTAMIEGPAVILGRKGSVGSVFFLDRDCWPHDTTLWVKDFKGNSPLLIYYMFRGLDLKTLDSGAANPALNRNNVHPITISWPTNEADQNQVAARLKKLESRAKDSGAVYEAKLAALDELKQSILQKAFSGQLTKDMPELENVS